MILFVWAPVREPKKKSKIVIYNTVCVKDDLYRANEIKSKYVELNKNKLTIETFIKSAVKSYRPAQFEYQLQ